MTRILIVEDERNLALGLRANLEVEGYDVTVAESGEAALRALDGAPPDLVMLDLMLPGIDGYEVLTRLRSRGIDAPVLLLSARAEEIDKVRGFRAGADDYVTKPFGVMELLLALLANGGAVVPRTELLRTIWGYDRSVTTRTVDAHVAELRRKLEVNPAEPRHILTVHKVGYRLRP